MRILKARAVWFICLYAIAALSSWSKFNDASSLQSSPVTRAPFEAAAAALPVPHDSNHAAAAATNPNLRIAGFTDAGYVLLAVVWYERMQSLGYSEHVIVAVDDAAVSYFRGTDYRVDEYVVPRNGTYRWARQVYRARVQYCAEQVRRGRSLLLTDVDNTFSRYVPLSDFQASKYDVYHAYGTVFPKSIVEIQGFVVCGGFTFYTANRRTLAFLEHVLDLCGPYECDDQGVVNAALALTLRMSWDANPDDDDGDGSSDDGDRPAAAAPAPAIAADGAPSGRRRPERRYGNAARSGRSNVTGHSVMVWPRRFAFRGPVDPSRCPRDNWVAMPLEVPKRYRPDSSLGAAAEKLKRIALWEKSCGGPRIA